MTRTAANAGTGTGNITVFYDRGCSLCRREVNHYRRIDKAGKIDWIDITAGDDELRRVGLNLDAAMRRMYVLDPRGELHSGAKAFVTLWSGLPFYRRLAALVTRLHLLPVLEWSYQRFARWRYKRRCRDGFCGTGIEVGQDG